MDTAGLRFPLNDDIFKQILDLIQNSSGLRFDDSSKTLITRRLSPRIAELHLDSFEKYYLYLCFHPNREAEIRTVFDLLTTHETYFFREEEQLQAFINEIIPQLLQDRAATHSLRIWSAGCSSGEEPYTIVMLCDGVPGLKEWDVQLFATDISRNMIAAAKEGIYGEASFRCTPAVMKSRYFNKIDHERYRIREEMKEKITFLELNLLQDDGKALPNDFDIIFCRNVMIYFVEEARRKIIEIFYRKLRFGGYLLLGQSELLIAFNTAFQLRHLDNDLVYQK